MEISTQELKAIIYNEARLLERVRNLEEAEKYWHKLNNNQAKKIEDFRQELSNANALNSHLVEKLEESDPTPDAEVFNALQRDLSTQKEKNRALASEVMDLKKRIENQKKTCQRLRSELDSKRSRCNRLKAEQDRLLDVMSVQTLGDLQRLVDEFKPAGTEVKVNFHSAGMAHLDAKSFPEQRVNSVYVGSGESEGDEIRVWIDGETLRVATPKDTAIEVNAGGPKLTGTLTVNGTLDKVVTSKKIGTPFNFHAPPE